MSHNFRHFREAHPKYNDLYTVLMQDRSPGRSGRVLATAASLVYGVHGDALGPVADEIIDFVDYKYPPGYADRYIKRVAQLANLQRIFDQDPSSQTLGDANAYVDPDDYSLSLLLSIVLTNHRFEIMNQFSAFVQMLAKGSAAGRVVSIGAGTGYELLLAARALPRWEIEAYEINHAISKRAEELCSFFQVKKLGHFGSLFPLEVLDSAFVRRYDAVIMCELCEHLRDPLSALCNVREYLKEQGRAFITMAINIAQEDHIFLYPSIKACRTQLHDSGLHIVSEWLAPQAVLNIPVDPEKDFKKGNYLAVVQR